MMVDISFIIPVYNTDKKTLFRCVNSICNSGYENYEIIVVNDGSSEQFSDVFVELEGFDRRIKVLHKENGGAASSRNYGIKQATGSYISFVDADDRLTKYFFEAFEKVKDSDLHLVIGGTTDSKEETILDIPEIEIKGEDSIDELICNMISNFIRFGNYYIGRGPWARIVKTEFAQKIQFDENLTVGEDICWNIDLIRYLKIVGILKLPIYNYSLEGDSVTRSFNIKAVEKALTGIKAIEARINKENKRQYEALLKRYFEEIERLYRISRTKCTYKENKEFKREIYHNSCWSHIVDEADFRPESIKTGIKEVLYKTRFLFVFFYFKYKLKRE